MKQAVRVMTSLCLPMKGKKLIHFPRRISIKKKAMKLLKIWKLKVLLSSYHESVNPFSVNKTVMSSNAIQIMVSMTSKWSTLPQSIRP